MGGAEASTSSSTPHYECGSVEVNDGTSICYDKSGEGEHTIILLHGWSGSRKYFDPLCESIHFAKVYRLDHRCHGESERTSHGLHVARLAADLHCFISQLHLTQVFLLGASMGCAVIWSYIELYGEDNLKGCIFIDQAPLQYRFKDWQLGSTGCYDSASLLELQRALEDMDSFADDNALACFSQPLKHVSASEEEKIKKMLKEETLKCDGKLLGKLMSDHTQLDWRPLLPRIKTTRCINLVGKMSKIFPWEGVAFVGEHISNCENVFYENGGHWLYIEEPSRCAEDIVEFMQKQKL